MLARRIASATETTRHSSGWNSWPSPNEIPAMRTRSPETSKVTNRAAPGHRHRGPCSSEYKLALTRPTLTLGMHLRSVGDLGAHRVFHSRPPTATRARDKRLHDRYLDPDTSE